MILTYTELQKAYLPIPHFLSIFDLPGTVLGFLNEEVNKIKLVPLAANSAMIIIQDPSNAIGATSLPHALL